METVNKLRRMVLLKRNPQKILIDQQTEQKLGEELSKWCRLQTIREWLGSFRGLPVEWDAEKTKVV